MRKYYQYLLKYKIKFYTYILLGAFMWGITLISPYITGKYLDYLMTDKTVKTIYKFSLIIFFMGVTKVIISYIFQMNSVSIKIKATFDLNYSVLEHVKKLPLNFFQNVSATYLTQRINSDSNNLITFLSNDVIDIFFKWISFLIAVLVLLRINTFIAIALSFFILLYLVLFLLFKSAIYNIEYTLKEDQDNFIGKMNDQLLNIKQIKVHSAYDYLGNQLKITFKNLYNTVLNHTRTLTIFSSYDTIISNLFRLIVFFFGGMAIINDKLTIGEFTMINNYFNVAVQGVRNTLSFSKNYQKAKVAQKRLDELLNMKIEENGVAKLKSIDKIKLKNISFSYNDNYKIFEQFNYNFEKGKIYCIIGENGTGKSTLIDILLGLQSHKCKGQIIYNDKHIKELDMDTIRQRLIGVSEQEPVLFSDTFINNIFLGNMNLKENDLKKWMTSLFNDENSINKLYNDMEIKNNNKSTNISGGEKQKIAIIRGLIKEPDLIILDEPTSALDEYSIQRLIETLISIKNNKIIIVVTHNESLIDIGDEIIHLSKLNRVNNPKLMKAN